MRKGAITATLVLGAAAAALAVPHGLSGVSFGVGAPGLADVYMVGEIDLRLSDFVCLGWELGMGFGHGGVAFAGAAGRFYVIPHYDYVTQPYMSFGGGIARRFDDKDSAEDEESTGGYITFGAGTDFDIPDSPVSPYLDLGGHFFAGDESEAAFKIEIGARFNVF
jgi:hypothetical protein